MTAAAAADSFAQLVVHPSQGKRGERVTLLVRGVAPYGCQTRAGPCLQLAACNSALSSLDDNAAAAAAARQQCIRRCTDCILVRADLAACINGPSVAGQPPSGASEVALGQHARAAPNLQRHRLQNYPIFCLAFSHASLIPSKSWKKLRISVISVMKKLQKIVQRSRGQLYQKHIICSKGIAQLKQINRGHKALVLLEKG